MKARAAASRSCARSRRWRDRPTRSTAARRRPATGRVRAPTRSARRALAAAHRGGARTVGGAAARGLVAARARRARAAQQDLVYALVRNVAHTNVADHVRRGQAPDSRRTTRSSVVRGHFGSYPNFFFEVEAGGIGAFADELLRRRERRGFRALRRSPRRAPHRRALLGDLGLAAPGRSARERDRRGPVRPRSLREPLAIPFRVAARPRCRGRRARRGRCCSPAGTPRRAPGDTKRRRDRDPRRESGTRPACRGSGGTR